MFLRGERVKMPKSDPATFVDIVSDTASIIKNFADANKLIKKRYKSLNISYELTDKGLESMPFLQGGCSVELLAYTALGKDRFFKARYRNVGPSIGRALLQMDLIDYLDVFDSSNIVSISHDRREQQMSRIKQNTVATFSPVDCYYRGLYENYRPEYVTVKPYHWPTVIYCPIMQKHVCEKIETKAMSITSSKYLYIAMNIKLTMSKMTGIWSADSVAKIKLSSILKHKTISSNEIENSKTSEYKPTLGVCTVVPYSSSNPSKLSVNAAILYEWMRYYQRLGIRVFIYDRDGANYQQVFHSPYSNRHGQADVNPDYKDIVHYYNFTMRGILDSERKGLRYDNTENFNADTSADSRRVMTGIINVFIYDVR